MHEIFVGRQPIYNRNLGVYAYELLFRSSQKNTADIPRNGNNATSHVIINTFVDMGLENLVGKSKACINLSDYFLKNQDALPVQPENIILDIQKDTWITDQVIQAIINFKQAGFILAIEDIKDRPGLLPLLPYIDILRLDIKNISDKELILRKKVLAKFDLKLLAEKIETLDDYEDYMNKGFEYFQGYFLSHPRIIKGNTLETNKLSIMNLLSTLHNAGSDISQLENTINTDLSISYKLLKLINSAFFNLPNKVESIRHAIVILGRRKLTGWASMLAMSSMHDRPVELVQLSMIRAKTCELLARQTVLGSSDSYFTVGMFSALDILMERPINSLLEPLPLSDDIKQAIINKAGNMGQALTCALAIEQGNWESASYGEIEMEALSKINLQAINWANEVNTTLKS
ncbi:MAG: EAL and HDOD domain-containing protein [Gammaproteobacteria bacterium]